MPKTSEQLVEEAKKELIEKGFLSTTRSLGLEVFFEAQIRLAYDEGYKQGGVDEQICMEKSGEHHINCKPTKES